MKRFNLLAMFGILLLTTLIFQGCSKPEGCTDANAKNYDAEAEVDCGCCTFEGQIVFWYSQATSNQLTTGGATSLTYYVDGQVVGSGAANVYWTGAPACGQNGSVTVTKDLGSSKSKSYSYKVVDQDGDQWYSGTLTFEANTCTSVQLQ